MTDTVTLVPPAPEKSTVDQAAALLHFASLRLQAHRLLERAANLPGLPRQHQAQAKAASNLAGLRLHLTVGAPWPDDAMAYRDDLLAVASIVDELVEQMGLSAKFELGLTDAHARLFKQQLTGAHEGDAAYVLEQRAEELRDEIDEQRRSTRRHSQDRE